MFFFSQFSWFILVGLLWASESDYAAFNTRNGIYSASVALLFLFLALKLSKIVYKPEVDKKNSFVIALFCAPNMQWITFFLVLEGEVFFYLSKERRGLNYRIPSLNCVEQPELVSKLKWLVYLWCVTIEFISLGHEFAFFARSFPYFRMFPNENALVIYEHKLKLTVRCTHTDAIQLCCIYFILQ